MREIKFRAWHKALREMFVVKHLQFGIEGLIKADTGTLSSDAWHIEDIELMQYTGLKDCKGTEIWEGDIVRINHPHDMTGDFTNTIGEVFWWDEEGGWYHGNQHGRPPKRMWKYVEVVGNIYERAPELTLREAFLLP